MSENLRQASEGGSAGGNLQATLTPKPFRISMIDQADENEHWNLHSERLGLLIAKFEKARHWGSINPMPGHNFREREVVAASKALDPNGTRSSISAMTELWLSATRVISIC